MRCLPGASRGSYNSPSSPLQIIRLPAESLEPSFASFICIVLLQIAVVIILTIVVFVDLILQHYNNRLTSNGQLIYTLLITVAATLVATATEGELRRLWAYVIIKSGEEDGDEVGEKVDAKNTSVVLGLAKLWDTIRRAHIPVVFGLAGLITTAIVTGLQPTEMVVVRDMPITLSQGRDISETGYLGGDCNSEPFSSSDVIPSKWFTWPLPSDTARNLTISSTRRAGQGDRCPTDYILPTFQTYEDTVSSMSYTLPGSGIRVDRTASGVPYSLIHYSGFNWLQPNTYRIKTSLFGTWSMDSFAWASLCVPLITRKVARCQPADGVKRMTDRIEAKNGNCTVGRALHPDSEHVDGEMVSGACTEGRSPGKATIIIGATDDYAVELWDAAILSAPGMDWPERGEKEFSVACEIDLSDSFSFHRVMIDPFDRDSQSTPNEYHTWLVTAARMSASGTPSKLRDDWGEECAPLASDDSPLSPSRFLTPETLAAGAASSWQLLSENLYRDGHLTTLLNSAEEYRYQDVYQKYDDGPNGVPTSKLEELLTQAARMAVGFHLGAYPGDLSMVTTDESIKERYQDLRTEVRGGKVAYRSVRVGVKEPWGLVFILPELIVLGVLGWLWWRVGKTRETGKEISKGER